MELLGILKNFVELFVSSDTDKLSLFLVFVSMALIWFTIRDKRDNLVIINKLDASIRSLSSTVARNQISEQFICDQKDEKTEELIHEVRRIGREVDLMKRDFRNMQRGGAGDD